ncbi:MAG: biotin transporter BioY [Planctomycetota bacterium]
MDQHAMPERNLAIQEDAVEATASSEQTKLLLRVTGVGLFPLFVALGAQVAIPLPPYGIPMTLQTLAVVLSALCLGPKLGASAMALYALMGVIGVPLFAEGEAGWQVILGQTGGYLLGFIVCVPVITSIIKRRDGTIRGWGAMITGVVTGHLVVFFLGVPWLWFIRSTDPGNEITWANAWYYGMVVFLPGMFVKSAIAVWIGKLAAPWASRNIW